MAKFTLDATIEPTYIDVLDVAQGYGVFSVPVDDILPGDQVQLVALVVVDDDGVEVVAKSIDQSQRADGFYEYVTQSEIDAHFTLLPADVAALANLSEDYTYSVKATILRSGNSYTREVQGGAIAARPTTPLPPLIVNSITLAGGPTSGAPGTTHQLTATTKDGFGNTVTGVPIAWASTDIAVATVDVNGLVHFVTPGTVTITATCQGLTATTTATTSVTPTPANNNILVWVSGDAQWEPVALTWSRVQSTPTTLAGYGITDAYTKTASDARYAPIAVPWSSLTGTPTTLAGYGITDAYTKSASDARYAPITSPHVTGLVVDSGGLTVTAGTSALQAITGTTLALTSPLAAAYGGTGVNNGSFALTLSGNLTTIGAHDIALTTTGNTALTLPASGTLLTAAVTSLPNLASIGTDLTVVGNITTTHAVFTGQECLFLGGLAVFIDGSGRIVPDATNGMQVKIATGSVNDFVLVATGGSGILAVPTGTDYLRVVSPRLGFYDTSPVARPTISGSRSGNAALASLLTQLAAMGLVIDGTTA